MNGEEIKWNEATHGLTTGDKAAVCFLRGEIEAHHLSDDDFVFKFQSADGKAFQAFTFSPSPFAPKRVMFWDENDNDLEDSTLFYGGHRLKELEPFFSRLVMQIDSDADHVSFDLPEEWEVKETVRLPEIPERELIEGELYLRLFHGRPSHETELDDWGPDGPVIGPLQFIHTTYKWDVKLQFRKNHVEAFRAFFPDGHDEDPEFLCTEIYVNEDCIEYQGMLYGDWSAFVYRKGESE